MRSADEHMTSFTCHVFGGTKRVRRERIVRHHPDSPGSGDGRVVRQRLQRECRAEAGPRELFCTIKVNNGNSFVLLRHQWHESQNVVGQLEDPVSLCFCVRIDLEY